MTPPFSKIPVAPLPGVAFLSGLRCGHPHCFALFSSLEDSEKHAAAEHDGKDAATTCDIYERRSNSGKVTLYRVLEESGKYAFYLVDISIDLKTSDEEDAEAPAIALAWSDTAKNSNAVTPDRSQPLSTVVTPPCSQPLSKTQVAETLSRQSTASSIGSFSSSVFYSNEIPDASDQSLPLSAIVTPPCSQPIPKPKIAEPLSRQSTASSIGSFSSAAFYSNEIPDASNQSLPLSAIATPSCSQPVPKSKVAEPLSRQSTASSIGSSSPSAFHSYELSDEGNRRLNRILALVQEIADQCRICWVGRVVGRPHKTFRCAAGICAGTEWQRYKSDLPFRNGEVCYFCFLLFSPPFNHAKSNEDSRQTPDMCEYPDVLKELVYILYQDPALRKRVFTRLGTSAPTTLYMYKKYIAKSQTGGMLGAYKVVDAYLDLREEEQAND